MESNFIGNIIGFVSCLLCAMPFYIIGIFGKGSITPINFWSGDQSLKDKIKNVSGYNLEMSKLYKAFGTAFIVCGISWFISNILGVVSIFLICTVGFYIVYKRYKKILQEFSEIHEEDC